MTHLLAVLGLGASCVVWFLLQRATGRLDEDPPELLGDAACGSCTTPCERAPELQE